MYMPSTFEQSRNIHLIAAAIALISLFLAGQSWIGMFAMFCFASNLAFAFENHFVAMSLQERVDMLGDIIRQQCDVVESQAEIIQAMVREAGEHLSESAVRAVDDEAPLVPGRKLH